MDLPEPDGIPDREYVHSDSGPQPGAHFTRVEDGAALPPLQYFAPVLRAMSPTAIGGTMEAIATVIEDGSASGGTVTSCGYALRILAARITRR